MKYVVIIPDGAADEAIPALNNRTVLESAQMPCLNFLASVGQIGTACHTPAALPAGSDVANMSVLGCNPLMYYTGRAPLEAVAQGIELGPNDWAVRCNVVQVLEQIMTSFTAGHISTSECTELLAALQHEVNKRFPTGAVEFYPGVSYRNLLVLRQMEGFVPPLADSTHTCAPHDYSDRSILDVFPKGPGCDLLSDLMAMSVEVFDGHSVNQQRATAGKPQATNVWLWGQGKRPELPKFNDRFGLSGVMITAVDLLKGIGTALGFDVVNVPGATGFIDTNYRGKAEACIEALKTRDFVCIHIEAPDESGHEGSVEYKLRAMADIDRLVVQPVWEALNQYDEFRLLVTPDHPTPVRTKTHSHDFVPWLMAGTGIPASGAGAWNETTAHQAEVVIPNGWEIMDLFIVR